MHFYNKFIIRTPLLPHKKSLTRKEIFFLIEKKEIQEAIFLASPILHSKINKLLTGSIKDEKEKNKVIVSIYKYLIRMMNRATPFGLFAGNSVGKWGEKTKLILKNYNKIERHTTLDMLFLCNLTQHLQALPEIKNKLKYFPNTSISFDTRAITYINYIYNKNNRFHTLNKAFLDENLKLILDESIGGKTIACLVTKLLQSNNAVSKDEAFEYIYSIIDAQILISELEPKTTGKGFLAQLIDTLKKINKDGEKNINNIIISMEYIRNELKIFDSNNYNNPSSYHTLSSKIKNLGIDFELSKLFQVNLNKLQHKPLVLDKKLQEELLDCITFLEKHYEPQINIEKRDFIIKFYSKFEDKEIPLLDAMNPEKGIGFPVQESKVENSLLQDIPKIAEGTSTREIPWDSVNQYLLSVLMKESPYSYELDLHKQKILQKPKSFKKEENYTKSVSVFFQIIGENQTHQKIVLKNVGGSSSINLLNRFANSNTDINDIVKEIVELEEASSDDNYIIAEITHLPNNRVGNVIYRPSHRKFEIPYLAQSDVSKENQIPLSDIVVSVDMNNNKIFLRSKRLNKRIIPILSNAYNQKLSNQPVFRFLCQLQHQKSLFFSWRGLSKILKFFPRVCYKKIILTKAMWNLTKQDFKIILENNSLIDKWRKDWKIPSLITLVAQDNELLIDFENPLSVTVFLSELKNKENIRFSEFFFCSKTAPVRDEKNNSYINEFIGVILKNQHKKTTTFLAPSFSLETKKSKIKSSFLLGSEWLYYKFYCGVEFADDLLLNILLPLINKYIQLGILKQWFFIRYYDPDFHIRFRLNLAIENELGAIIRELSAIIGDVIKDRLIWKIQTDTYKREIKRYGIVSMELSENLFFHDSTSVVECLKLISTKDNSDIRWQFAILSVDNYLSTFHFSMNSKYNFVLANKENLGKEFGIKHKVLRKKIDLKYRKLRNEINSLFSGNHLNSNDFSKIIKNNLKKLQPLIDKMLKIHSNDNSKINQLLSSYIHMHINRLFRTDQRMNEFVVYYLLEKHYKSVLARLKYNV